MKQTAVEFLVEELNNGEFLDDELTQKAKEIEKQQQGYSESDLKQAFAYNNRLNSEQSFKDWLLLFKNK